MYTGQRCTHCFYGTIVNGSCNWCQQPEQTPEQRGAAALPLQEFLHDRYYVGDVLGSGGFGITYSAWDIQEERRVALKELFPAQDVARMADRRTVQVRPGQEEYFQHVSDCFVNEAKILIQLQGQPGIVSIYNLFNANGTLYYTMEYLDGMDLRDFMARYGKLTWDQLSPILSPILQALEILHNDHLIHRDISPDNIFLTGGDQARLIDFGSVRTYQGTRSFTTFMKHSFAPWEQYQSNGDQGPWTDIYALCVTIYYALTGVLPPKAPDRKLKDTTVPLTTLCPQLPRSAAAAIQKGMAVEIADRFSDVRLLAQALYPERQLTYAPYAETPFQACLVCVSGYYRGGQWSLPANACLRIGRQPYCEINYPANMTVISGLHCSVAVDAGGTVMVRDENSRNGTYLDYTPLRAGVWYRAASGCHIRFSQEDYLIQ